MLKNSRLINLKILPILNVSINNIVKQDKTIISIEKSFELGTLLLTNRDKLKTKTILIIFEPKILPKTNSNSFFLAARRQVTSSGNEVPNAIAVAPMTSSEILNPEPPLFTKLR